MMLNLAKRIVLSIPVWTLLSITIGFAQITVRSLPAAISTTQIISSDLPDIGISNTSVSAFYGTQTESVAARYTSSSDIKGITQSFTWNSASALSGIGLMVSAFNTDFSASQLYKLEIHKLIPRVGSSSILDTVSTEFSTSFIIPATSIVKQQYLYLQFAKTVALEFNTLYGFHLVPIQQIALQQVAILRSNSSLAGNGSQSTSIKIASYRKATDSPDYNFFLTAGEGTIFQNLNLLLNKEHLLKQKNIYQLNSEPTVVSAVLKLLKKADTCLELIPKSVMLKKATPVSGTKHDYLSQAVYWWPNPDTPDGLPYIRIDGKINHEEVDSITDQAYLADLEKNCKILSLAYFFSGDEKYAAKAAELLKVWFLNPATRMNPNLNYCGSIPGVNEGLGSSVLESHPFTALVDWIGLIQSSNSLSAADFGALKKWFSDYLEWLKTSKSGKTESTLVSNRGTYYNLQLASYALFTGDTLLADSVFENCKIRIGEQFDALGMQPLELDRANAYSYSTYNLTAWTDLANLSKYRNTDLWQYESIDGKSIRKAIDWIAPYALRDYAPKLDSTYDWDKYIYKILEFASVNFVDPYYTIRANEYAIIRNYAILKAYPNYAEYLLYSFSPLQFPDQITVSNVAPLLFKPTSSKIVSRNDSLTVLSETSVSNTFGLLTGSLSVSNDSSNVIKGIKQTFTWNSTRKANGIGILVSNLTTDSITQQFKLVIHELIKNVSNPLQFTILKTLKTYTFSIHPTDVGINQYLNLQFGTPLTFIKGKYYGFYLVPLQKIKQEIGFVRSGSWLLANGSATNSLTVSGYDNAVSTSPSFNFYIYSNEACSLITDLHDLETSGFPAENIQLFPNPVSAASALKVCFTSQTQKFDVAVTELNGAIVRHSVGLSLQGSGCVDIKTTGIDPGMYIVRIRNADGSLAGSKKLIIQ